MDLVTLHITLYDIILIWIWSVDSISSSFNSYTDNDTALANINFDSLMYNIQIYPPNVYTVKSIDHNHCRSNRGRTSEQLT